MILKAFFIYIRLDKLVHEFFKIMRITTFGYVAYIVCFQIFHCIDAAYNER